MLAALASYVDAGSIMAGAAGLALWAQEFDLGSSDVGLIAAFSSNGISAGMGALAGGWLADRFGRKRVYQWDLLLYAFGVLWIVLAIEPWMLILGYVLAGLAVGADIPASWTLIAENAPAARRGRHSGAAQLLWTLGPLVVLVMALALSGLGLLGIRIVFAHLLVVSLVLWALRQRMDESRIWERASTAAPSRTAAVRALLSPAYLRALLFLAGMYGIWNLYAGTGAFFLPYISRTVGALSQAQSVALAACIFILGLAGVGLVFMRFVDRVSQRALFGVSIALQIAGTFLLASLPLSIATALGFVLLTGLGAGFGPQAFFGLWSAESFPTMLRGTALGFMYAIVRIALGIWSLFVPGIAESGVASLAWLLTGFLVVSGVLGLIFAPANAGKRLEELQPVTAAPPR